MAAFGAGALLSAVSFELVQTAVTRAAPATLAAALALGALAYYAGDRWLDREAGSTTDRGARGRALLLGATLDGVPESFILGLSLASGGDLGLAFFVAVLVSNFPEGMASAAEMAEGPGGGRRRILLTWLMVVAASAVAAAAGAVAAMVTAASGALAQAFAAGALLTMLMDDLIPEARERAGIGAGLLGVLGFAVAFALHQRGG